MDRKVRKKDFIKQGSVPKYQRKGEIRGIQVCQAEEAN